MKETRRRTLLGALPLLLAACHGVERTESSTSDLTSTIGDMTTNTTAPGRSGLPDLDRSPPAHLATATFALG
jgi:hypothetical protein